jgi:rare lipoprotein A
MGNPYKFSDQGRARVNAVLAIGFMLIVAACGGPDKPSADSVTNDRAGKMTAAGGIYKIGNPYQIFGDWFYPQEDPNYVGVGIGSWYGEKFHGRLTANGEIFDMNLLTAAHPTLPMPVRLRVTNLENGRSVIVRMNDRGPFAKGREIDLSKRAADVLGYKQQGTAKVKVEYLGRAPLYDKAGKRIYGTEEDVFIAARPVTPTEQKTTVAAPITDVVTQTLDGTNVGQQDTALPSDSRYAVSLGVFSDGVKASQVKKAASAYGNPEVVSFIRDDKMMYRVIVGGANIRDLALPTLEKVVDAGYFDAYIVEQ